MRKHLVAGIKALLVLTIRLRFRRGGERVHAVSAPSKSTCALVGRGDPVLTVSV